MCVYVYNSRLHSYVGQIHNLRPGCITLSVLNGFILLYFNLKYIEKMIKRSMNQYF